MKAVVQRVREARVLVDGRAAGEIGAGLCVLLGVADRDGEEDAARLAGKVARLRIFENEDGKFDRSLLDVGGEALVVNVPSRVAAVELKVPLHDPPNPKRATPMDPDAGPLRRLSPRRSWPEVAEFDQRLERLAQRHTALGEQLTTLEQNLRAAELADKQSIAAWQLQDAEGERPTATVPPVEAELEQLRGDLDSTLLSEEMILRDKGAHVAEHRKRLISDAKKARSKALERLQRALHDVEQARDEAAAAIEAERWAKHFPSEAQNPSSLQLGLIRGRRLGNALPELKTLVSAGVVLDLLREDAAWLAKALADPAAQPLDPHFQAIFEDSPEGREAMALANERIKAGLRPKNVRTAGWEK